MKGYKSNPTVERMSQIEITGNIIPLPWYYHLRKDNGKPYSIAIELLADIVYWYKPIAIRDETSGQLLEYRKKFKADKLQRNYAGFSEMYGYTHEQVKDALRFLEDKNIIDLDFRNPTINNVKYGNLLFIGLNVDTLLTLNTPPLNFKVDRGGEISQEGMYFKVDTNTEITTEITQNNNNFPNGKAAVAPPAPKKKLVVNQDHLKPSTPESIKVFQALTKVQRSKGRGEVKYFSNDEQKARLEEATGKLKQAGKFEDALLWALQNERTSRVAMVNALVTWAENLDKPKPEYKNGSNGNGYHKQTTQERNIAALQQLMQEENLL